MPPQNSRTESQRRRERTRLRWWLKALTDDGLLRVHLRVLEPEETADPRTKTLEAARAELARGRGPSRGPQPDLGEFERAFWAMAPGDAADQREDAWKELAERLADRQDPATPLLVTLLQAINDHLKDQPADDRDLLRYYQRRPDRGRLLRVQPAHDRDLLRYYGVAPLFPEPPASPPLQDPGGPVEIHCHFRGAVPLAHVWMTLMTDARARASHRRADVEHGPRWNRAELLAAAAELHHALAPTSSAPDTVTQAALARARELVTSDAPPCRAAQRVATAYLALYANFAAHLRYRREHVGLTRFTDGYDRYSRAPKRQGAGPARKLRDDSEQTLAILCELKRRGIAGVELRPTLDTSRIDLQRKLRGLVLGYLRFLKEHPEQRMTFGIVPSIFKQEAKSASETERIAIWERQIAGLLAVIDELPLLRLFVVGIDAAGREQGCPVRSLAAPYRQIDAYHRAYGLTRQTPGRRMARWIDPLHQQLAGCADADDAWEQLQDTLQVPRIRLGMTVHVGEDFVDPLTGLREIDEALDHLPLRPGDRLGHALAAGLDDALYAELLQRRAALPGYRLLQREQADPSPTYLAQKPVTVDLLDRAWASGIAGELNSSDKAALNDPTPLHGALAATAAAVTDARRTRRDLAAYPPRLPTGGLHFHELEKLDPRLSTWVRLDEAAARRFQFLRRHVLGRIARAGLTIESCPTSNLVVAHLELRAPYSVLSDTSTGVPVAPVALAADDPAVFGAWLDQEIQTFAAGHQVDAVKATHVASFL